MGILTNALNEFIRQGINLGFDQIDNVFTTLRQQGRDAEAMRYLMSKDDQFTNALMNPQQSQGIVQPPGGVLPTGMDMGNYDLPQVAQIQGGTGMWSEDAAKSFSKASPWIQQLATQRGIQDITHDPRYAAAELAQKEQEAIINALGSGTGTLYGKGNIGNMDVEPSIRRTQSITPQTIWGNAAQGAALVEKAKGPEWQRRHDIAVADQIRVKQTPGARAEGSGGGGGKPVKVGTETLNYWNKQLAEDTTGRYVTGGKSQFTPEQIAANPQLAMAAVLMGGGKESKTLTPEGQEVLNMAEKFASQDKTLSPRAALNKAKSIVRQQMSSRKNAIEGAKKLEGPNPTAIQKLPKVQPPQSQIDTKTISEAKQLIAKYGKTPKVIEFLKSKGIDPDSL